MLKARATRNQGGVVISGTGGDLEELYCALNALMEKHDGQEGGGIPESGTNFRIVSLRHDIRHALPVPTRTLPEASADSGAMHGPVADAGRILSFETGKELPFDLSLDGDSIGEDGLEEPEELEELEDFEGIESFDEDFIDTGELDEDYDEVGEADEAESAVEVDGADGADLAAAVGAGVYYESGGQTGLPLQTVCEFRIMWPEVIFDCLVLREYLGSRYDLEYDKKQKGLDWTLDWVVVRRFQIVVLECLCLYAGPTQAKSIRKIFMDSFASMDGYCTQYVDKLVYVFAGKNAEQRLRLLPQLPKKMVTRGSEYQSLEAEMQSKARKYGCPTWELDLVEEVPADFKW
ncbi:MAG: hypothetical protein ABIJ86_14510 [Spirochaetota bacterium]